MRCLFFGRPLAAALDVAAEVRWPQQPVVIPTLTDRHNVVGGRTERVWEFQGWVYPLTT
jgi:hypothetical protein